MDKNPLLVIRKREKRALSLKKGIGGSRYYCLRFPTCVIICSFVSDHDAARIQCIKKAIIGEDPFVIKAALDSELMECIEWASRRSSNEVGSSPNCGAMSHVMVVYKVIHFREIQMTPIEARI